MSYQGEVCDKFVSVGWFLLLRSSLLVDFLHDRAIVDSKFELSGRFVQ